jgi:hypothetical protein
MGILYYIEQLPYVLGGSSVVVEVDETQIFTRKYHRRRALVSQSVWVVGAICRRTIRPVLKIGRKRYAVSLTKFVTENIAPG